MQEGVSSMDKRREIGNQIETLEGKIEQCEKEKKQLETQLLGDFYQIYPAIKDSKTMKAINSHPMKIFFYDLVRRCPSLMRNEEQLCAVFSFREVLCSDILVNDSEMKKFMNQYISDHISCNIGFRSEDMETILKAIPYVSRELLLQSGDKEYLRRHIDNSKVMQDLFSIHNLYQQKKDEGFLTDTLLENIFVTCEEENPFFKSDDPVMDQLKISVLLYTAKEEIISHFEELSGKYPTILDHSMITVAMLKALSVFNQDRFLEFLKIEEVREDVLNSDGFYHYPLIDLINDDRLDDGYYGDIFFIFCKYNLSKEEFVSYFDSYHLENIYFYDDGNFCKTPTAFYQQFSKNAFFDDKLISYCINHEDYLGAACAILIQGNTNNIDDEDYLWEIAQDEENSLSQKKFVKCDENHQNGSNH